MSRPTAQQGFQHQPSQNHCLKLEGYVTSKHEGNLPKLLFLTTSYSFGLKAQEVIIPKFLEWQLPLLQHFPGIFTLLLPLSPVC
jgi:hypothetical protein